MEFGKSSHMTDFSIFGLWVTLEMSSPRCHSFFEPHWIPLTTLICMWWWWWWWGGRGGGGGACVQLLWPVSLPSTIVNSEPYLSRADMNLLWTSIVVINKCRDGNIIGRDCGVGRRITESQTIWLLVSDWNQFPPQGGLLWHKMAWMGARRWTACCEVDSGF